VKVPTEEHFPRFTLDDNEHVCLIATYVAAGRWQEINMLPGQPQPWFLNFAHSLKGDGAESINSIFTMLQHVLMAQHKTDFLAIQLQPAFSAFSRANAVALTKAAKVETWCLQRNGTGSLRKDGRSAFRSRFSPPTPVVQATPSIPR
jgi:hypothetical protein